MYASNEDEEWIYLHKTPSIHTVLQKAMNFVDRKYSNSSESDRSISLSSISSTELENAQIDDLSLSSTNNSTEQQDSVLYSHHDIPQIDNNNMISKSIVNEKFILHDNSTIDASTIMNENYVLDTGFELSNTSSTTNGLRRRTGIKGHNSEVIQPISMQSLPKQQDQNKNDKLVSFTCLMILLSLSFILGQMVTQWDQPMMNTMVKELIKINQRLNEIKEIPIKNFEEKLTKQLENKIENLINQQLIWQEDEKFQLISQIYELQVRLNKTQQNLTDTIHQLKNENERLQERIKLLGYHFPTLEEQYPKIENISLKEINSTKSSSSLIFKKLFTKIFKQTTSMNISNLFENLSASLSNILDHRHEYIQQSKRKLTGLTSSTNAFRQAKTTYIKWMNTYAHTRININQKHPWRWMFRRSYNRERQYSSKFSYPINKLRSIKSWMKKKFF